MIRRWLPIVSLVASTIAVAVALLVFVRLSSQDGRINGNRVEIARESCRAQNERHDKTIGRLDDAIGQLPPGEEKQRAARNREFTVSLIDALAPKRDCRALVEQIRSAAD